MTQQQSLVIIDSHTGGEPTRTIVSGGPNLGKGSMAERRDIFQRDFDYIRTALVNEPRGSDVMVGAIICEPVNPDNAAGVIFFNNVGFLNMCGHGTIGVAATLHHLGKIGLGKHTIETPVGDVVVDLETPHKIAVENVASYRWRKDVTITVPGFGNVCGDIAWGGNWFYLIKDHGLTISLAQVQHLMAFTLQVKQALAEAEITGEGGAEIDHIELFASPPDGGIADSQNFVLCPGAQYDRSPCGTGTSAKLACLYSDGLLHPGQIWRQQSIVGSVFEGQIELRDEAIIPSIKGEAFINLQASMIVDNADPYRYGIACN